MKDGYIYIMSNESFSHAVYKIGFTGNHPEKRAAELSASTSCPTPFNVEFFTYCTDMAMCEKIIHSWLYGYRINDKREFFKIALPEAIRFLIDAAKYAGTVETNIRLKHLEKCFAPVSDSAGKPVSNPAGKPVSNPAGKSADVHDKGHGSHQIEFTEHGHYINPEHEPLSRFYESKQAKEVVESFLDGASLNTLARFLHGYSNGQIVAQVKDLLREHGIDYDTLVDLRGMSNQVVRRTKTCR